VVYSYLPQYTHFRHASAAEAIASGDLKRIAHQPGGNESRHCDAQAKEISDEDSIFLRRSIWPGTHLLNLDMLVSLLHLLANAMKTRNRFRPVTKRCTLGFVWVNTHVVEVTGAVAIKHIPKLSLSTFLAALSSFIIYIQTTPKASLHSVLLSRCSFVYLVNEFALRQGSGTAISTMVTTLAF
jgi:hypothetical protein